MLAYSEDELTERVSSLSPGRRAAFAVGCARHLWSAVGPAWARNDLSESARALERCATILMDALEARDARSHRESELTKLSTDVEALLPADEDPRFECLADELVYVQFAVAALLHAAAVVRHGDVRAAVWAARQAYDSADQRAQRSLHHQAGVFDEAFERQILATEIVQGELARQDRALAQIAAHGS